MSQSESAEPEFKSWSYDRARKELWPEEKLKTWKPGDIPPESIRKPIDDEIKKLLAPERSNSPRLRFPVPVFAPPQHVFLTFGCDLNTFCAFREVRAHWIPFAIEVAQFEADRHKSRADIDGDTVQDMREAIKSLRKLCAHDEHALARLDRSALGSWNMKTEDGHWPETEAERAMFERADNKEEIFGRAANKEEKKLLRDPFSVELSSDALSAAKAALTAITANLAAIEKEQRSFLVRRRDYAEWKVSFAGTLGFAWYRLTGAKPSNAPDSPFSRFVHAAYQSLDSVTDESWDRACRMAADRYAANFAELDRDPALFFHAGEIWEKILVGKDSAKFMSDMKRILPGVVIGIAARAEKITS